MSIIILLRAVFEPELARGVRGSSFRLDSPSEDAIALGLGLQTLYRDALRGLAIGPPEWDVPLREAVSLGLDEVTRLWAPSLMEGDLVSHAKALADQVPADARVVVAGGMASDHGSGLVPFAIAEFLGWPIIERAFEAGIDGAEFVVRSHTGGGRRTTYRMPDHAILIAAPGHALPYPTVARKLAARKAVVPLRAPAAGPIVEPAFAIEGYGPARPVTRHLLRPSATGSAGGRLRQLMAGGASSPGPARNALEADAGVAAQLADLLEKEGLLD